MPIDPLDPLNLLAPTQQHQRISSFWELRQQFRSDALASLRRREGLPTPELCRGAFYQRSDGGFYREPPGKEVFLDTTLYPNGQGGFTPSATGTRKGAPHEEADKQWGRSGQFEILSVAEDGRRLADELRDLDRDAAAAAQAGRVSHGALEESAPDLRLDGTGDDEVDRGLQEYLNRERGQR